MKYVLNRCVVCKKMEGRSFGRPPTANLPELDFAGPLFVKGKDGQMTKVYIAFFTCCITRAVHLELVEDLSTETFKRCLRRFIARRGVPTLMVSDNAKTFKSIDNELRILYGHPFVREELENRRIQWRFNLERAPGGVDFSREW